MQNKFKESPTIEHGNGKSTCYKRSFAYFLIKTIIHENPRKYILMIFCLIFSLFTKTTSSQTSQNAIKIQF